LKQNKINFEDTIKINSNIQNNNSFSRINNFDVNKESKNKDKSNNIQEPDLINLHSVNNYNINNNNNSGIYT